jgi:predicted RNase H-related nuclease YkuK (DUF458 family)
MNSSTKVELKSYIESMKQLHRDVEIHIGCDSQNYKKYTVYVTTLVFRFPKAGAHVLYQKEKVSKITDMWTKLWGELERSITLAVWVEEKTGIKVQKIDLDFNEDPKFASNRLLQAASGYVSSMGFLPNSKPNLLLATWAANVLCH